MCWVGNLAACFTNVLCFSTCDVLRPSYPSVAFATFVAQVSPMTANILSPFPRSFQVDMDVVAARSPARG